jgi:hypothetical protein
MWSDPEGLLVKAGSFILVSLTLARFIVYEYKNLRADLRRKRRRR